MALTKKAEATTQERRLKHPAGTPSWAVAVSLGGLLSVFIGERVLSGMTTSRGVLSGLGTIAVISITAIRWSAAHTLTGERRTTERTLALLCTAGVVGLLAYFTTAEPIATWMHVSRLSSDTRHRYEAMVTCFWVVLILASTVPLVFAELALHPMRHAEHIEWRRVRDALVSGVTLALVMSYGALFTYVADELNIRADFSYFRTARPSESTKKIVQAITEPIKVFAFFPSVNEVGSEVSGYLRDLGKASPMVQVGIHDRLLVPVIAKEAKITQDGVIVLIRGQQQETLTLGTEMNTARPKLKSLDVDFQKTLMKVLRERRTVYLTVGHGELNDTQPTMENHGRTSHAMHQFLEMQNYMIREFGLVQGLGKDIPDDATVVMALGPTEPFAPEELSALKRYLDRGGHALFALDPEGKAHPEAIADTTGLSFKGDILCNENSHAVRRYNDSDNSIIFTNRFSSHPSISTLSRLGSRPMFFAEAASLEKAPNADASFQIDFTVRSLPDTFADKNNNFLFDSATEQRASYNLVAAVSKPVSVPSEPAKPKTGPPEMRAVVVADADAVSDAALLNPNLYNGNPQFVMDAVRWLGGEERLSGAVAQSTEDVRIEHTKQKDTLLFYSTIFGAPAVVLGLGLGYTRRGRPGSKKKRDS